MKYGIAVERFKVTNWTHRPNLQNPQLTQDSYTAL